MFSLEFQFSRKSRVAPGVLKSAPEDELPLASSFTQVTQVPRARACACYLTILLSSLSLSPASYPRDRSVLVFPGGPSSSSALLSPRYLATRLLASSRPMRLFRQIITVIRGP